MRTSQADILIVPGWSSSGEHHWQTRWERSLKTARRVEQADWLAPVRAAWVARIHEEIAAATQPVLLVAHSLGVIATVATLTEADSTLIAKVAGAFLVAPADVENAQSWPLTQGYTFDASAGDFTAIPNQALPLPSTLIASINDPYCSLERAKHMATIWGATFIDAGESAHINADSGHGPWPDGLMQLGAFLRKLSPSPVTLS